LKKNSVCLYKWSMRKLLIVLFFHLPVYACPPELISRVYYSYAYDKVARSMHLTSETLDATYLLTKRTLKKFPTKSHFFLNFGLSATLVSAFMRVLMYEGSENSHFIEAPVMSKHKMLDLIKDDLADQFFSTFMPPKDILGRRKLVVTRALYNGDQLADFVPALFEYLKRNGFENEVVFNLVIPDQDWIAQRRSIPGSFLNHIYASPSAARVEFTQSDPLAQALAIRIGGPEVSPSKMSFHFYSRTTPYEAVDTLDLDFKLQPNPQYRVLYGIVRAYLSRRAQNHGGLLTD
jgi:hypothetical protein